MRFDSINAGHLRAIADVLALESPDLLPAIEAVVRRGPERAEPHARGQSSWPTYRVEMSPENAAGILTALEMAARKYGQTRQFFGFQLTLLLMVWANQVARLKATQI